MADMIALFGSLLVLGITFPSLLATWWLLFPATVDRARLRLEQTPWRCFWFGGILLAGLTIPIVILLLLPYGPSKFIGWSLIVLALSISSLGAAGIASKMGERIGQTSSAGPAASFLRGALLLELGVFFPVIGWFIAMPLLMVVSLGATGFALLHWMPRRHAIPSNAEAVETGV